MKNQTTFNLRVISEGDFDSAIGSADIYLDVLVTDTMVKAIFRAAEHLIATEAKEIILSADSELWPLEDIEQATGIIIDPSCFDLGDGTQLVVRKTCFFWRVVTQAFGVIETESVDFNSLISTFNDIHPAQLDAIKNDAGHWLVDLCDIGSNDWGQDADNLKSVVHELVKSVPSEALTDTLRYFRKLANDRTEHGGFPELHIEVPGSPRTQGERIIKQGDDLIAKLEGKL